MLELASWTDPAQDVEDVVLGRILSRKRGRVPTDPLGQFAKELEVQDSVRKQCMDQPRGVELVDRREGGGPFSVQRDLLNECGLRNDVGDGCVARDDLWPNCTYQQIHGDRPINLTAKENDVNEFAQNWIGIESPQFARDWFGLSHQMRKEPRDLGAQGAQAGDRLRLVVCRV